METFYGLHVKSTRDGSKTCDLASDCKISKHSYMNALKHQTQHDDFLEFAL